VSSTGAWSAVIVKVAAPPSDTLSVLLVIVSSGVISDSMVTCAVLGDPI